MECAVLSHLSTPFFFAERRISEPQFWRNYFYRVSLLREQLKVEPLSLFDEKVWSRLLLILKHHVVVNVMERIL